MLDPNDLKIETFRSKGKGGQNVNKVESAVRITHLPTGLQATCQDERDQAKNKLKALSTLEERVVRFQELQKRYKLDRFRKSLYTGRVRTYDLTKGVVTDYRTKKTARAKDVLDGNLELIR